MTKQLEEFAGLIDEEEESIESTYLTEMKREAAADRTRCKEMCLRLDAEKFKPIVLSDQCPGLHNPYKYFPEPIMAHAHKAGVISDWDILNYRKWRRKVTEPGRVTNISKGQMAHKVRIDIQIINYFRNI